MPIANEKKFSLQFLRARVRIHRVQPALQKGRDQELDLQCGGYLYSNFL